MSAHWSCWFPFQKHVYKLLNFGFTVAILFFHKMWMYPQRPGSMKCGQTTSSNLCCHLGTNDFKGRCFVICFFHSVCIRICKKRQYTAVARNDFISNESSKTENLCTEAQLFYQGGRGQNLLLKSWRNHLLTGTINCITHLVPLLFLPTCMIQT